MPTVLITGANRGFGFLLARLFLDDGWSVLACCRTPDTADDLKKLQAEADDRLQIHALDVTDFSQVDALAAELHGTPIDVLVNNAGVLGKTTMDEGAILHQSFGQSDFDEWDHVFAVNAKAPMKVAEAFVEHVAASERKMIVTLTSIVGSVEGNTFGGLYAYRASKSAANAVMKSMAVDLAKRDIIAFPIHPGYARTDMGGVNAEIDPMEGARGVYNVIASATPESAGRFWSYTGDELPW